jgi:hypothetical protein
LEQSLAPTRFRCKGLAPTRFRCKVNACRLGCDSQGSITQVAPAFVLVEVQFRHSVTKYHSRAPPTGSIHDGRVGGRRGGVQGWPSCFRPFRLTVPHSPLHRSVSGPRHIEPSRRISRTRLSAKASSIEVMIPFGFRALSRRCDRAGSLRRGPTSTHGLVRVLPPSSPLDASAAGPFRRALLPSPLHRGLGIQARFSGSQPGVHSSLRPAHSLLRLAERCRWASPSGFPSPVPPELCGLDLLPLQDFHLTGP